MSSGSPKFRRNFFGTSPLRVAPCYSVT